MIYLRLATPELAVRRVANRARHGGHSVPAADIRRRFHRGWQNFLLRYRPVADMWAVYDNSGERCTLINESR